MAESQKKLLSLIKQNLKEMAMKFDDDNQSRPEQSLQNKLSGEDTPLKKVPLPQTGDEPNTNFQELLASERYKEVVQNVRRYTGINTPVQRNMMPLMQMVQQSFFEIIQIESQHREELENLAVQLVIKEMAIPEGSLQFDAKIVSQDEMGVEDFKMKPEEGPNIPQVDIEKDLFNDLETINLERAKRRLINNIIQGSSKKGHYMFHMVEPELTRITGSPRLLNLYGVLMSINDVQYWQFADELINGMNGQGEAVGGKEEVDRNTNPPTITARAFCFPVLIHELIKGVMEVVAIQGRPEGGDEEGEEGFDEDSEDTLQDETWDLRLGPAIWNRLRAQFPEDILIDENKRLLQLYLLQAIFKLPAKNFLVFMREVLQGSPRGKRMMNELMNGVNELFNEEDPNPYIEQFDDDLQGATDETDDDDIDAMLDAMNLRGGTQPEPEVNDDDNLSDEEKINRMLDAMNDAKKNRGI